VLTRRALHGVVLHCIAGTLEAAIHEFTDQPRIPRLLVMASGAEVAHQTPAKTFRPTVMEVRCASQEPLPGPGGVYGHEPGLACIVPCRPTACSSGLSGQPSAAPARWPW
jgi:hypothetical protein